MKRLMDIEANPPYTFRLIHMAHFWPLLFCPPAVPVATPSDRNSTDGLDISNTSTEDFSTTPTGQDISGIEQSSAETTPTLSSHSTPSTTITEEPQPAEISVSATMVPGTETRETTSTAIPSEMAEPQVQAATEPELDSTLETSDPLDNSAETSSTPIETSALSPVPAKTSSQFDDSFSPDPDTRPIYTAADLPASDHSYVAATFFVHKLISNWELWTRFEEPLLFQPKVPYHPKTISSIVDLYVIQSLITQFAFAIAAVTPWRNHPCRPPPGVQAKSMAGWVLSGWNDNELWQEIDGYYGGTGGDVVVTFEEAMTTEVGDAMEFKRRYGQFWGGKVLAGAIFRWCELCDGRIEERELEALWKESQAFWMEMGKVVGSIHWEFVDEEKEATPGSG